MDILREQACQRALTQKRTLWGGGALQLLDLRLLEDGGERGGALGSDVVACHAASEGPEGNGERVGVSTGADRKANAQGPVRGSCGLLELLQRGVALKALGESGSSLGAKKVGRDTASTGAEAGAEAMLRRANGH